MTTSNDRLLRVDEVANQLQCCEGTVRKLIRDKTLPALKLGRDYRVNEKDIQMSLSTKKKRS